MTGIQCFWAEPTERAATSFRRYSRNNTACAQGMGYHDAQVPAEEIDLPLYTADHLRAYDGWGQDDIAHDDPRWPTKCDACDYVFQPDDHWQHNAERIYEANGERFDIRHAPVGTMWDCSKWSPPGPDGIALMVMLPGGVQWSPDQPAQTSEPHVPWNRSGIIPNVTCTPSVQITGGWHGFLREGKLVDA